MCRESAGTSMTGMFIALRDLGFARGRFALIGGVIALLTFMVVMLTGLTAGLGAASVSAVEDLPVDHLAFQEPAPRQNVSFTNSALSLRAVSELATRPGTTAARPLGVSTTQLRKGETAAAVTLIGAERTMWPRGTPGPVRTGQLAVPNHLADDEHLRVGDEVVISGRRAVIAAVVADTSFNHLPVVYTDLATWQHLTHTNGVTAVGLNGTRSGVNNVDGVRIVGKKAAFGAVGGYSSEQASLNLMRLLLIVVSVLVVGSFFTVWTMQRSGDLAVVRALGGSRGYLLRDALGQALIVLLAGAAAGAALSTAVGVVAAHAVPFELTVATVVLPLTVMTAAGLVGATASIRRITGVDPLAALGAAR
jgi:FtsX-like permease family protein